MTAPAPSDAGAAPPTARFVRALPWCVAISAVATLTPILVVPVALVAHLPTFFGLLGNALANARRARNGENVSPASIAAVVGGLVGSVALMLIPMAAIHEDRKWVILYWFTWLFLPVFALVGSGLAAATAGLCRLVFPPTSKA